MSSSSSDPKPAVAPLDTLRLTQEDKLKLVAFVESQGREVPDSRRRLRVDFHGRKVFGRLSQGDEVGPLCALVPRNLSAGGFSFVHGVFVNSGMRCRLTLPMVGNRWCQVNGVVRRCRHIQGIVHEVSVVFDEEIDLADMLTLTPQQRRRLETEALGGVTGTDAARGGAKTTVMLVDPDPTSRAARSAALEAVGCAVAVASSNHAARELLAACRPGGKPAAAVLAGAAGAERAGVAELRFDPIALVSHLRRAGLAGPVLLCGVSADAAIQRRAALAGVTALLGPSIDAPGIARTVNSHLRGIADASPEEPLVSLLAGRADAAEAIDALVHRVPGYRQRLRRPGTEKQPDALVPTCEDLLVHAVAAGFPEVSDAARRLHATLVGPDEAEVRAAIDALDKVLGRVPTESEDAASASRREAA